MKYCVFRDLNNQKYYVKMRKQEFSSSCERAEIESDTFSTFITEKFGFLIDHPIFDALADSFEYEGIIEK